MLDDRLGLEYAAASSCAILFIFKTLGWMLLLMLYLLMLCLVTRITKSIYIAVGFKFVPPYYWNLNENPNKKIPIQTNAIFIF